MSARYKIYRDEAGQQIPGERLLILHSNPHFHSLGELIVFRDGMVECIGLTTFDRFRQLIEDCGLRTRLPEGARLVTPLGTLKAMEVQGSVQESELLKDVLDTIEKLNGRQTAAARCVAALAGC